MKIIIFENILTHYRLNFYNYIVENYNLDIIFSEGGKHDKLINCKIDRHARIFNDENDLKKNGYVNASKNDLLATKFFNTSNKIGLIFH